MSLSLFCAHREFIDHLEAEIEWLRLQMLKERQRAELAIDHLLRLLVNAGPVSVPLLRDEPAEREEGEVERLIRNPEFTGVGQ